MNYLQYDIKIVKKHGMKLVGWPLCLPDVVSPYTIYQVDEIRVLRDALNTGTCKWTRLSKREVTSHALDVEKQIASGELTGMVRKIRSDKGTTKKRPAEEVGDNIRMVKKQKTAVRGKGKVAVLQKRVRSQLPPMQPTSKEFISDSSSDSGSD